MHNPRCIAVLIATVLCALGSRASAQPAEANYDESKVPEYTLPDPLITAGGERVESADQWHQETECGCPHGPQ